MSVPSIQSYFFANRVIYRPNKALIICGIRTIFANLNGIRIIFTNLHGIRTIFTSQMIYSPNKALNVRGIRTIFANQEICRPNKVL